MVHDISLPDKRSQISPKEATGMASILEYGGVILFNNPVRNGMDGAGHNTPSISMGTPLPPGTQKMSVLFNTQSNKVKVGYFGKL